MGAYNTLTASYKCPKCKCIFDICIQFKYGEERLYNYNIGDAIIKNINYEFHPEAKAYGVLCEYSTCYNCGFEIPEEFDIIFNNGVITGFDVMEEYEYWDNAKYSVLMP